MLWSTSGYVLRAGAAVGRGCCCTEHVRHSLERQLDWGLIRAEK